ncbi:MAG: class I SAM-dependent methyltransferase [Acidimicrobiales bacterium]
MLSLSLPRPSVAPLFDRVARRYDTEILQRINYRPAQDEILAALRFSGASRIVDVGCGTGILATRIHDELSPAVVYGVDASPGMLAQAAARSSSVRWLNGPAEQLPLPDGDVDAAVSTHAFHFFDKPAALADFHRVLAPGGHVVIVVWAPTTSALGRLESVTGTAFPTRRQMRECLQAAGFQEVEQRPVRRPGPLQWLSREVVTLGVRP